ncbi:radical SAM protein [Clostridium niameyense]|uniref:Radical SAM protein n=1 Tax=Clostridium niameyense TaxID=1622073 RepID=A0A6M0R7C5_9CLOT|nr:radical SAM protein [Clostridium niameyense]NEZ46054.1 radical SAM protein [Clostridium niameyense]
MSRKHYIIPIFVPHEGCPHNCVFCNQDKITGINEKVDAAYTINTIEKYIKTIPRENSTIEVSFFGGTFTAIPIERQNSFLKVAKDYKDKGIIDYIHMSTRPDYIDEDILDNLKKYSVDIIELGVQSLDEEVLLKSGRGHSIDSVYKASKLIKDYGITLGHQIMLGLPSDSFKKDIETVRKSIEMKPDIARIYPALVIKQTPMEYMLNEGIYKPYTLEEAIDITKILYSMYVANDVQVIRIGLQPTEEINKDRELVEGPFHPAFRELVEGKIMNEMILDNIIKNYKKTVEITINNKDLSKLYCNKKKYFKEYLGKYTVKVVQSNELERGSIILSIENHKRKLSLLEYMLKLNKEVKSI